MKLYYSETVNPRKACAVARYLDSPVEFVLVDLARGEQRTPEFLAINPNGRLPVLQDGALILWEANAIMCYLSDQAGADLWPHDARQVAVMRWLSWDMQHFSRPAGTLYFENLIRPQIGMGAPDAAAVDAAASTFRASAAILDAHLRTRRFLLGDTLTVADFATASTLPHAGDARIPLAEFPAIASWHARLQEPPAWRAPFPDHQ
jgi:glutathione S-transferase